MEDGGPSATARRVAAHRLGFGRVATGYGDPAADEALAADVVGGLTVPAGRMHDYLAARTAFFDRAVTGAIDRGVRQIVTGAAGHDGRASTTSSSARSSSAGERFGDGVFAALRGALEPLVTAPDGEASPLFAGLEPCPGNWRAAVRPPVTLPHYPMVLHRGGYPTAADHVPVAARPGTEMISSRACEPRVMVRLRAGPRKPVRFRHGRATVSNPLGLRVRSSGGATPPDGGDAGSP